MQVSTILLTRLFLQWTFETQNTVNVWFRFTKTVISYWSPNWLLPSLFWLLGLQQNQIPLVTELYNYHGELFIILPSFHGSFFCLVLQEDLTPKDINDIIDELKAGRVPPPGPRFIFSLNNFSLFQSYTTHFRVLSISSTMPPMDEQATIFHSSGGWISDMSEILISRIRVSSSWS